MGSVLAMAGKRLVFQEASRASFNLQRGWRTPDPSPTRSCLGLPGCANGFGEWIEEELRDEDYIEIGTPRGHVLSLWQVIGDAKKAPHQLRKMTNAVPCTNNVPPGVWH